MKRLIYSILILVICGHSSFGQKTTLTRRYKKIEDTKVYKKGEEKEAATVVGVQLFLLPEAELVVTGTKSGTTKGTVYDLKEEAQAAYITAYVAESKGKPSSSVQDILCHTCPIPKTPRKLIEDRTLFQKELSFDIVNELGKTSAGRISTLNIKFKVESRDLDLWGFKDLVTKYDVFSFGSINSQRTRSFTANAGVEFAGTGSNTTSSTQGSSDSSTVGPEENRGTNSSEGSLSDDNSTTSSQTSNVGVGFAASNVLTEQISPTERFIALKGAMSNEMFQLYMEGAPLRDLNDKITVTVFFRTKNNFNEHIFHFDGMGSLGKFQTDISKLSVQRTYCLTPIRAFNVNSSMSYGFSYREIKEPDEFLFWDEKTGRNTPQEGDDVIINYATASPDLVSQPSQQFIKNTELYVGLFGISNSAGYLEIAYQGTKKELLFPNFETAEYFLQWMWSYFEAKLADKQKPDLKLNDGTLIQFRDIQTNKLIDVDQSILSSLRAKLAR